MTDPDHYLMVQLKDFPQMLRIDDFIGADELYLTRCKIEDISAYITSTRLIGVVFIDCDLTRLPEMQKRLLVKYSDKIPHSFTIRYESKKQAEQ